MWYRNEWGQSETPKSNGTPICLLPFPTLTMKHKAGTFITDWDITLCWDHCWQELEELWAHTNRKSQQMGDGVPCGEAAPGAVHRPLQHESCCFTSTFQMLHEYLLWTTLTWNHIGKVIWGNTVLAWLSWPNTKPVSTLMFQSLASEKEWSWVAPYRGREGNLLEGILKQGLLTHLFLLWFTIRFHLVWSAHLIHIHRQSYGLEFKEWNIFSEGHC